MTGDDRGPSVDRIAAALGDVDLPARLARATSGDLTTLLLAVVAERASRVSAPRLLARYLEDRFSRPAPVDLGALRAVEDAFLRATHRGWDRVVVSPLLPIGAHHALGDVAQDRIVTATRANEVAADPTVGLALEAAARRRDSTARRSDGPQDLATLQRITRAQRFDAPEAFVHFSIAALVTAGRSQPDDGFDADALLRHLDVHLSALAGLADRIEIVLSTQDTGPGRNLLASIGGSLVGRPNVRLAEDPDRIEEQGYYRRACFKINVDVSGSTFEVGDGGFTDWTERLLDDRRERLLTSALGLDRLALAMGTR